VNKKTGSQRKRNSLHTLELFVKQKGDGRVDAKDECWLDALPQPEDTLFLDNLLEGSCNTLEAKKKTSEHPPSLQLFVHNKANLGLTEWRRLDACVDDTDGEGRDRVERRCVDAKQQLCSVVSTPCPTFVYLLRTCQNVLSGSLLFPW